MPQPSPLSYTKQLQVAFHDLDPLHIVWHGNYMKYFDATRFALFDSVGIDLYRYYQKTNVLFPVTKTSIKYVHPLQYRDDFVCHARVVETLHRIVIDFSIRLVTDDTLCAKARSEQVAVLMPHRELALEIPADIRRKLVPSPGPQP